MATQNQQLSPENGVRQPGLVLRSADSPKTEAKQGTWWPASRQLSDELPHLFASWPPSAGRIVRVLYSPPDWDDRPRAVEIPGRGRVKTGNFPDDDTHQLVLAMLDGHDYTLAVMPPMAEVAETTPVLASR